MTTNYNEIRPYEDFEVKAVLKRMSSHPWLVSGIKNLKFKNIPRILDPIINMGIKLYLKNKLSSIDTIDEFQLKIIADLVVDYILRKTTDSFTWSGLENLSHNKPYIFVSNHRDIVLDPALINYILAKNGFIIGHIAFGDNLLINDFVSDLIRLNRAFIVKRNLTPKAQLRSSIELSEYIYTTLKKDHSIWIAQREGRAKDGNDRTNPALLKMLYLHFQRKKEPFQMLIKNYNVVAVSVSYEMDPCDVLKAKELFIKQNKKKYIKGKNEDLISMSTGITGYKGRVHISFSSPIKDTLDSEDSLAECIDKIIHSNYKLWPTNYLGYDLAYKTDKYNKEYDENIQDKFIERFANLTDAEKEIAYKAYAMPVVNKGE